MHELAAFGVFGLLIAADRYKPDSGWAFSTYANFWIKKFIRLYLDEISGIVPQFTATSIATTPRARTQFSLISGKAWSSR